MGALPPAEDPSMNEHSLDFLKRLLSTPGPSGDEAALARVWRDEAATFADNVRTLTW